MLKVQPLQLVLGRVYYQPPGTAGASKSPPSLCHCPAIVVVLMASRAGAPTVLVRPPWCVGGTVTATSQGGLNDIKNRSVHHVGSCSLGASFFTTHRLPLSMMHATAQMEDIYLCSACVCRTTLQLRYDGALNASLLLASPSPARVLSSIRYTTLTVAPMAPEQRQRMQRSMTTLSQHAQRRPGLFGQGSCARYRLPQLQLVTEARC